MKAALITTDGTITSTDYTSLKTMQMAIGGYLQMTGSQFGWTAYVDEEGLMKQLEHNPVASEILGKQVVGPAIVFAGVDDEGHEIGLTDEQLSQLLVRQARRSVIDYFQHNRRAE